MKRFGDDWVEHKVVNGVPQVRLKTYAEYRQKMSVPGSFLLIQSEELTDQFQGRPIHINVTNIKKQINVLKRVAEEHATLCVVPAFDGAVRAAPCTPRAPT